MIEADQIVYLNGKFLADRRDAKVSVLDRGFIYGDGVYELVPVYGREPFRLPQHLARLQHSLDGIGLANPHTNAKWEALIRELVARQPFDDQGVYFQVTRGVAKRDHAFPQGRAADGVHDEQSAGHARRASRSNKGVAVVTADDNRWHRCDLKTISLLGNVLMRQLAADARRRRDGDVPRRLPDRGVGVERADREGRHDRRAAEGQPDPARASPTTRRWSSPATPACRSRCGRFARAEALAADEMWLSSSTKEVLAITTRRRQARSPAASRARCSARSGRCSRRRSRRRWRPRKASDHPVRAQPQRLRDLDAERLRRPEVDDEVVLLDLVDGQVGRILSLQDPVHVAGGPATQRPDGWTQRSSARRSASRCDAPCVPGASCEHRGERAAAERMVRYRRTVSRLLSLYAVNGETSLLLLERDRRAELARGGTRARCPWRARQVTTSPTNTTWSPARWRE